MLRLDSHYLWDSWIADDGENYLLYVLSAPKAIGGPEHRHANAVVAHAVSSDLVHWELSRQLAAASTRSSSPIRSRTPSTPTDT